MDKKLIIIGASGHGKVLIDIANSQGKYSTIAFLDDDISKKDLLGCQVVGTTKDIEKYIGVVDFIVGIGNNEIRERIQIQIEKLGGSIATLIDQRAIVSTNAKIGAGTVVMPGVVINSSSVIGKGCIINTGSVVEHDNTLADFVHISPNATLSGTVKVGERSWIGSNATVINNIEIANDTTVGAGTIVIRDLPSKCTVVGNPAKVIKHHE